jgi:hypothetical protein
MGPKLKMGGGGGTRIKLSSLVEQLGEPPKVYLAGKIRKDCWRNLLLKGLRDHKWKNGSLNVTIDWDESAPEEELPLISEEPIWESDLAMFAMTCHELWQPQPQ